MWLLILFYLDVVLRLRFSSFLWQLLHIPDELWHDVSYVRPCRWKFLKKIPTHRWNGWGRCLRYLFRHGSNPAPGSNLEKVFTVLEDTLNFEILGDWVNEPCCMTCRMNSFDGSASSFSLSRWKLCFFGYNHSRSQFILESPSRFLERINYPN